MLEKDKVLFWSSGDVKTTDFSTSERRADLAARASDTLTAPNFGKSFAIQSMLIVLQTQNTEKC